MSEEERDIVIKPIARVHSPFQGRFGILRRPGLVPSAIGEVRLPAPVDDMEMLQSFSHVLLTFRFDR